MTDTPTETETDEDEAATAGDDEIVVDERVLEVAAEIERVNEIVDPTDRLAAARDVVQRLNGEKGHQNA
jgi:hypothetical protein